MKRNLLCTTIGATILSALFSVSASAQTCAGGGTPWTPDTTGAPTISDSTCGHETGIIGTCQTFSAPAAAYVAAVNITAAGTFTNITFTGGAGYTVAAYLVPQASGCNANAACTTTGDGTTPMLHSDIGPGSYFLIVTGADFDAPNACGTFVAAANGTLPVTLQNFTVG